MENYRLRYPIGKFIPPKEYTKDVLNSYVADIENFPKKLKETITGLSEENLNTPYREDGWTVRQVIHHCADSHMISLTRFKLALTEAKPVIKPYHEERWAELVDSKIMDVEPALMMLEGIHQRWTTLIKKLTNHQLKRTFIHPEHGKEFSIEENIGIYAWHCNHHLAHITELIKREKWKSDKQSGR